MLTRLRLENFKSWRDTGEIPLKPITGFFGTNSSGKSSLFQALLLMKQTAESPNRGIALHFGDEKTLVDLGDFESVIHKHDTARTLKFSLSWNAQFPMIIPEAYGSGVLTRGRKLGFEVEIGEIYSRSRIPLGLKEMSYLLTRGRRLGGQYLNDRNTYKLFAYGPDTDYSYDAVASALDRYQSKFYEFPRWVRNELRDGDFLFHLGDSLRSLLESMYYLGPLRASPSRLYSWSGSQPLDIGVSGESVIDAVLSARQMGERVWTGMDEDGIPIDEYISKWLRELGLAYDFRVDVLAEGRHIYEAKIRKAPDTPEVLLTDVGFGISQVLPVLVLCFYVPGGSSTVILEQPDIHLHPSAQTGLADIFIDAWKKHDVQILFESHSEHLLRRLQRRIAEGEIDQENVALFFCSTEDSGESRLSHLELDQYGNISNWPKDFFGDQFGEIAAMSEAALKKQVGSER